MNGGRHLVHLDVAGDMAGAWQKTGIMLASRLQPAGDGGDVVELPDLKGGADGETTAAQRNTHRRQKSAEVGVDKVPFSAENDKLAGLVSGNQERYAELLKERREVAGVDAAQGRRFRLRRSWFGCSHESLSAMRQESRYEGESAADSFGWHHVFETVVQSSCQTVPSAAQLHANATQHVYL
jgi:hypothetical protein